MAWGIGWRPLHIEHTKNMNRLWVKLSVTIGLAMILVTVLPLVLFFGLRLLGWVDISPPADVPVEITHQLQIFFERIFVRELIRSLIVSALTGIVLGIFISRLIARPLNKLAQGAQAIGAQDLQYRVHIEQASNEITAVADSFNQMADQLQRAEKQRQNLLADVAHELRTPLTVLQGNLQGILDDVFPLEHQEIGRLLEQTRHLTHLVNDLHELAQAEARRLPLNLVSIDLPQLIQQATAGFRPLAEERGIELRVELLGKLPALTADRDRLLQALNNLINNAIHYSNRGDVVMIQAEATTSHTVDLRVVDTGVGITPAHLPNVFDRFYRVDTSRQRLEEQAGTGLGLAIVRAVTEYHGGTASVTSPGVDKGATFTLTLPSNSPNS